MLLPGLAVYSQFRNLEEWDVSALPTILGKVDPRRFRTITRGQGADAMNVQSETYPFDTMDDLIDDGELDMKEAEFEKRQRKALRRQAKKKSKKKKKKKKKRMKKKQKKKNKAKKGHESKTGEKGLVSALGAAYRSPKIEMAE